MPRMLLSTLLIRIFAHLDFRIFHQLIKITKFKGLAKNKSQKFYTQKQSTIINLQAQTIS